MKAPKPGSFGHRGLIGKKVVAKEANRVSAKNARYQYQLLFTFDWNLELTW
jgi:hypothetical protein